MASSSAAKVAAATQKTAQDAATDTTMRIGIVTAVTPLTVTVQGAVVKASPLRSYVPVVADNVVLIKSGQSWVVLGAVDGLPGANSGGQLVELATISPTATSSGVGFGTLGNTNWSIVKQRASSRLRFRFAASFQSSLATVGVEYSVFSNALGTDRVIARCDATVTVNVKEVVAGMTEITGLAAGTQTGVVRWRCTAGSGTLTMDSKDRLQLEVVEVG